MEKRRSSYDLDAIKRTMHSSEAVPMTVTARRDATELGFSTRGIFDVLQSVNRSMFVKSMTTKADHRVWQDVYNVPTSGFILYVKFQADIVTEFRVMSFKER